MAKEKVLLTGASGSMGGEAFKELLRRRDKYNTRLLLRPSKANKKAFKEYENTDGVEIFWGDLTKAEDVVKAVTGVDHVLHPAALIAPAADKVPKAAKAVNTVGATNLVNAIHEQPHPDDITLVNICSVAAYGDRLPPIHMVRVGDPLKPSVGDFYATTKIGGERAVIESGLKHWASIRQTFIAIPKLLSLMDPIMFHQPPDTHIEFVTSEDAGYGLVQTLECPEDFYRRVYNMGGGPSCRITYYDMLVRTFNLFGLDGKKIMPRNWFTLRNFHCCWYADSDVLNSYTGHWRHSYDDYMKQVEDSAGSLLRTAGKIGGKIPLVHTLVRELVIRRYADPLHWIGEKDEEKIKAFFGSREVWENIGPWDEFVCPDACYDTVIEPYTGNDMRELAKSRGGEFLSPNPIDLDPFTKFQWKCAFGHEFDASPTLLRAGHWCPECAPPPWKWDDLCKSDPLLGTCYYNNHRPSESQCVEWLYCPNQ